MHVNDKIVLWGCALVVVVWALLVATGVVPAWYLPAAPDDHHVYP